MKEVKKFCLPNRLTTLLLMIPVFIIVYVIMLVMLSVDDDMDNFDKEFPILAVVLLIIMLIVFGIIYYQIAIKPHIKFRKRLRYFNKNNLTQYIVSDFQKGVRMFNNNVVVGEHCLISEEGNTSVSKSLRIVGGGKEYLLCSVNDWRISEPEYIQLCAFLKIKNPNIVIK